MLKRITILAVALCGTFLLRGFALAQTDNSSVEEPVELESLFNPDEGSGELRAVKEKIQSLLRENEELSPQVESVKQEFLDLQEKVKRSRDEVAALEKEHAQQIKDMRESGQPQSLRLLQSYDQQYQKKQLKIELKLQELALKGKQPARDLQISALQKELEENAAQEKQLADEAQALKKNNTLVYDLECLKQENALLEDQLKLSPPLQDSTGIKQGFGDSPPGPTGAAWEDIRRKEEEKARLQHKIEQLTVEQERSPVDSDISVFETQFRGSVERLEEENKQLKDQAFSLQKKIQERSSLKK